MRKTILISAPLIALGAVLTMSTPAQAQAVCELAGAAGSEDTGGSTATGAGALACGGNASATGDTSVAIGSGATAGPLAGGATLDHDGVAIGDKAKATGFHSTAIGGEAVASGAGSQAFGWKAVASGTQSAAVGNQAQATNTATTALGNLAQATGLNSTALGNGSLATGDNTTAIGKGANTAGFANSVALGAGSTVTAANQVNVGGRTIGGVAAGVLATDAVNVAQLNAAVGSINNGIAALQDDIGTLFDLRTRDRRDMQQGVAAAMAMAQAPMPSSAGGISYAVNGAMFRGEYAGGASMMYRLNTAYPMAVSVGISFAGNKNNGARIGIAGEF
jgi:autotransporter adhesin